MEIRILLVDDHKMFQQGLSSMLNENSGMNVIGGADNGHEAVRLAHELEPDLIVMDVDLPDINGIEASRRILKVLPNIKVIALSTYLKKSFVLEMLKAGASGYVLKEQAFDELVNAINVIIKGEIYLSSKVAGILARDYIQKLDSNISNSKVELTEREIEVLKHLSDGKSTKEIALLSNVSIQSVDAVRRRIMSKINTDNFADLIKYAIRQGLTNLNVCDS